MLPETEQTMPVSDEELFRAYLAGDEASLRQLMERYGDSLTLYLNGYIVTTAIAKACETLAFQLFL